MSKSVKSIVSKFVGIIEYLLKVFLISAITFSLIGFIHGIVIYINEDVHTAFSSPLLVALLAPIGAIFNIMVYLLLLFHKFNKYEVICETIVFSELAFIFNHFSVEYTELYYVLLWTFIMAIYLLIKKIYMKKLKGVIPSTPPKRGDREGCKDH